MKRALRSSQAQKDIEAEVLYYSKQSLPIANRFIDEYESAIHKIETMPGIGSLRFASDLDMPNLHMYPLRDFPYLIFYLEHNDHIDIVRVMHSSRDIFNLLLGID